MHPVLDYLLKLSVSLVAVSLFYYAILRRLTFYNWNRYYLLLYSALCFVIPFVEITHTLNPPPTANPTLLLTKIPNIHQIGTSFRTVVAPETSNVTEFVQVLCLLILTGTVFMLLRFAMHILSYLKVVKSARLVSKDGVRIYHVEKKISPFSFGNAIFYNPELHQSDELKDIILHEYIHVRQRHSLDMIWGELICIFNWFNPFAWLIRHAIRQNLEFIADQKVLEQDVDIRHYQYLLLKVAGVPEFRIANPFSFSSLKQRIIMMNKTKTSRLLLSVFVLSLPLVAGLLVIFRKDIQQIVHRENPEKVQRSLLANAQAPGVLYISGMLLDAETNKPLANLPLTIRHKEKIIKTIRTDENGFYYQKIIDKNFKVARNDKMGKFHLTDADYYIGYEGFKFYQFGLSQNFELEQLSDFGAFHIIFLGHEFNQGVSTDIYWLSKKEFFKSNKSGDIRTAVRNQLNRSLENFRTEHNLKVAFKKAYPWPQDVITKFGNGFFDRKKELIGYQDSIQFYLDGKKAAYQTVNAAFKSYPYMLDQNHEYRYRGKTALWAEIFYLTFPLHKDAPPAALLKGNIETRNVNAFDLAALQREPYFLDGFRQTFGVGSNMIPLKKEIRKIVLFKGELARYYDPKCERIWWIETRPAAEVFERPDLARLK